MEREYITKESPNYWKAIAVMFLGSVVAFGAEYCLQPVIPVLAEDFHLAPATASLAMSCGTGGMAAAMLGIASLARRLERKKTMTAALVGAALLAVGMAVSESFGLILALRLLQGILLAGFPAMVIAYINEEFDPCIIGAVVGIYVSGSSLGGLSGRMLISTLTDFFSWRYAVGAAGVLYLLIGVLFWILLPKPTRREVGPGGGGVLKDIKGLLANKKLLGIYFIAFSVMGAFVCTYNYISYVLMAAPYHLSQTAIGMVFTLYLVGTAASAVMGSLADRYGNGQIICLSVLLMMSGIFLTLGALLLVKIIGLALFTYGFFGAHCAACGWVGKTARGDKAQASAMYMLFYYIGASVVGTAGGAFLADYGWSGVVFFLGGIIGAALLVAMCLTAPELGRTPAALHKPH